MYTRQIPETRMLSKRLLTLFPERLLRAFHDDRYDTAVFEFVRRQALASRDLLPDYHWGF